MLSRGVNVVGTRSIVCAVLAVGTFPGSSGRGHRQSGGNRRPRVVRNVDFTSRCSRIIISSTMFTANNNHNIASILQ